MVPRANKRDGSKFWGCKDFPKCNGTRDSEGLSKEERDARYEGEDDEERNSRPKSRRYG